MSFDSFLNIVAHVGNNIIKRKITPDCYRDFNNSRQHTSNPQVELTRTHSEPVPRVDMGWIENRISGTGRNRLVMCISWFILSKGPPCLINLLIPHYQYECDGAFKSNISPQATHHKTARGARTHTGAMRGCLLSAGTRVSMREEVLLVPTISQRRPNQ